MNDSNPILASFQSRISYITIWFSVSILQAILNFLFASPVGLGMACLDALLFNFIFAIIILVLWYPIRYNTFKNNRSFFNFLSSTLLPYVILACILIASWITVGNRVMSWIFPHSDYQTFLRLSTGWRVLQGSLFFVVTILFFTLNVLITSLTNTISSLKQTIEKQKGEVTRITVKDRQQIHIIDIQEIDHIEAFGDYVQLHTTKGIFLKELTMKLLEEQLPSTFFIRIHRSYIVNIHRISKIELYEKERYHVLLNNGKTLKASESGYKLLRASLR